MEPPLDWKRDLGLKGLDELKLLDLCRVKLLTVLLLEQFDQFARVTPGSPQPQHVIGFRNLLFLKLP